MGTDVRCTPLDKLKESTLRALSDPLESKNQLSIANERVSGTRSPPFVNRTGPLAPAKLRLTSADMTGPALPEPLKETAARKATTQSYAKAATSIGGVPKTAGYAVTLNAALAQPLGARSVHASEKR